MVTEKHGPAFPVDGQDCGAVAAVVGLPLLIGPPAGAVLRIKIDLAKGVPVVGKHLDVVDLDSRVCVRKLVSHPRTVAIRI